MNTAAGTAHRYQRWPARLGPDQRGAATGGWVNIAVAGLRLEYKRPATQKLLWMSLAFVGGTCVLLYVLLLAEQVAGMPEARGYTELLGTLLGVDLSSVTRLAELREVLWRAIFVLMTKGQLFWVMVIAARVGPGLICRDIKAQALPIYFSKPITPLTYLLGKWLIVAGLIAAVTLLPNVISLILSVILTGGLATWGQTLHLGWDLVVSGLGVMLFGGVLVLAISSLTSDARYVVVGWLAICLLPALAQGIVDDAVAPAQREGLLSCISLGDNIVVLTEWLFDMSDAWAALPLPPSVIPAALTRSAEPGWPMVVLGMLFVGSAVLCYRQVLRFSRAAANL